jgi:hypothetical protein
VPNYFWTSVASSADGTKLAAVASIAGPNDGPIYTSTNSGTNWTLTTATLTNWNCIGSSADGTILVAGGAELIGHMGVGSQAAASLHISTNSGLNWTEIPDLPSVESWNSIVSSANGAIWVAAADGVSYTSTNGGTLWNSNKAGLIYSVASSADGTKLMGAAGNGGGFYSSTDLGTTWTSNSAPAWGSPQIASSADGTKLVVVDSYGYPSGGLIYTSTNGGTTWMVANAGSNFWNAVASSADGSKLVASAGDNGVYTWQSTPSPQLNIAPSSGNLVVSWVIPSTSFGLQQNCDLTSINWATVTNPPAFNLTNLQNQVILSPPPGNSFYRLQAQ